MTDGAGRQAATLRLAPALVEQTGYLLRIAFVRAGKVGAASLPEGTSVRFYGVLQTLTESGPRSQHELSQLLHVNRTMMVGLIDAMEGAGLVERRRNPADRPWSHSFTCPTCASGSAASAIRRHPPSISCYAPRSRS